MEDLKVNLVCRRKIQKIVATGFRFFVVVNGLEIAKSIVPQVTDTEQKIVIEIKLFGDQSKWFMIGRYHFKEVLCDLYEIQQI